MDRFTTRHTPGSARSQTSRTVTPQTVSPYAVDSSTGDVAAHTLRKRNLRVPRSRDLVDAVLRIDTTTDPAAMRDLMEWIREQYAARQGGTLVGLFGRCYLGTPYVDHHMTMSGSILEHFTPSDDPPPLFVPARGLARSDAYCFIEVYDDGLIVPIRRDGTPGA
ncbi:MAG TPA: hypothetical protein PLL54_05615 [Dermatophilaceae bacterium]|jgi:hypothetical protein|nr:hypothetical protein [Dermatophilaceae bacterium]